MLLPASIVIAALLVSVSLVYNAGKSSSPSTSPTPAGQQQAAAQPAQQITVKPVTSDDHILGDPNAPVKVVEYSDLECPFCKSFHYTMHQVVDTYGGKVAWVYRHSPLVQLHPKGPKEAEATECAVEVGGNDSYFWKYMDRLMELTPSNNGLDPAILPQIATYIGIDVTKFNTCLSSGKYASKVAQGVTDATAAGLQGTPYSVVLAKNGQKLIINGALPFTSTAAGTPTVKAIIDQALQ